jgi:hypothetical protein
MKPKKVEIYYFDWARVSRDGEDIKTMKGELLERGYFDVVDTFESLASDEEILDVAFERYNIGDHGGKQIRSMSSGDVLVITDPDTEVKRGWLCLPIGWGKINPDRWKQF